MNWGWALIDADKSSEADKVFARLLNDFPDSPHAADARFNLAESAHQRKAGRCGFSLNSSRGRGFQSVAASHSIGADRLGRPRPSGRTGPPPLPLDRLLNDYPDGSFRREAKLLRAEVALQADESTRPTRCCRVSRPSPPTGCPPGFARAVKSRQVQSLLAKKKWAEVVAAADEFQRDAPDDPRTSEVEYGAAAPCNNSRWWDDAVRGLSSRH